MPEIVIYSAQDTHVEQDMSLARSRKLVKERTIITRCILYRFLCIEPMAAAKYNSQLPIAAPDQEQRVFDNIFSADLQSFFDPEKIKMAYGHMMRVSKEIQSAYFDYWRKEKVNQRILITTQHKRLQAIANHLKITLNSDGEKANIILDNARMITMHCDRMLVCSLKPYLFKESVSHKVRKAAVNSLPPGASLGGCSVEALIECIDTILMEKS